MGRGRAEARRVRGPAIDRNARGRPRTAQRAHLTPSDDDRPSQSRERQWGGVGATVGVGRNSQRGSTPRTARSRLYGLLTSPNVLRRAPGPVLIPAPRGRRLAGGPSGTRAVHPVVAHANAAAPADAATSAR